MLELKYSKVQCSEASSELGKGCNVVIRAFDLQQWETRKRGVVGKDDWSIRAVGEWVGVMNIKDW